MDETKVKEWALNIAIEITKAYAGSAGQKAYPATVLEDAYNKLVELGKSTQEKS